MATRGRQPIGIAQPPLWGSRYPFVSPSDDVVDLLADLFLSYRDDRRLLTAPFQVAWLYGFGDTAVAVPSGYPTPSHDYDVLITDALGQTVFDSTLAGFTQSAWSDRLLILEWADADQVLRIVLHTAWSPEQTPRDYDEYIVPDVGTLDARTHSRLTTRLLSLAVEATELSGLIRLGNGKNTAVSYTPVTAPDGGRRVTRIRLDGRPGLGEGRSPGCADEDEGFDLHTVSDIGGNSHGNFRIEAEGCNRIQLSPADDENALRLFDDCEPCCTCDDYAATYLGLKRVWDRWQAVATGLEASRDTHQDNVDRWNDAAECLAQPSAKVAAHLIDEGSCRFVVGGMYCNASECRLGPTEIRFTFILYEDGVAVGSPPAATVCDTYVEGGGADGEEAYSPAGAWPVVRYHFDCIDFAKSAVAKMRLCLPDCVAGQTLQVFVSVHTQDAVTAAGETCALDSDTPPAEVLALWADLDDQTPIGVAGKAAPLSPEDPENDCGC